MSQWWSEDHRCLDAMWKLERYDRTASAPRAQQPPGLKNRVTPLAVAVATSNMELLPNESSTVGASCVPLVIRPQPSRSPESFLCGSDVHYNYNVQASVRGDGPRCTVHGGGRRV